MPSRSIEPTAPFRAQRSIIVGVDRAPRNSEGLVEAVSDVEILRPTVAANGNRRLFYEVLNHGGKLGLALLIVPLGSAVRWMCEDARDARSEALSSR